MGSAQGSSRGRGCTYGLFKLDSCAAVGFSGAATGSAGPATSHIDLRFLRLASLAASEGGRVILLVSTQWVATICWNVRSGHHLRQQRPPTLWPPCPQQLLGTTQTSWCCHCCHVECWLSRFNTSRAAPCFRTRTSLFLYARAKRECVTVRPAALGASAGASVNARRFLGCTGSSACEASGAALLGPGGSSTSLRRSAGGGRGNDGDLAAREIAP